MRPTIPMLPLDLTFTSPFRTPARLRSFATFTAVALAILVQGTTLARAEVVENPFPKPIPKSNVAIELNEMARGLSSPVLLVAAPDKSGRLYIVDQAGLVRTVREGALLPEPLLDVRARLVELNKDFDERGLLGLAFDPDFKEASKPGHRRLFTYTSEPAAERTDFLNPHSAGTPPNHQSVVASWKMDASGEKVDPASRRELMRIDQPQFNHNGGMIAFGPDGLLYIGLGDGGGANDLGPGHHPEIGNAQDPRVVLGKMLRIDVNGTNSANGAYGIPKDNPFVAGGGAAEIFAIGLRNPFRFGFHGERLLAGDVGQNKLEMVHSVIRGGNHGWRIKEGTFKFNIDGTIENADFREPGLTPPVLQYDRDEGTSVMGGFVYRGNAIPALKGRYIFGDYWRGSSGSGRLFVGDLEKGTIEELQIGADDRKLGFMLKGFGEDADGELYAVGSAAAGPSGTGGVAVKIVPVE